MRIVVVLGTRPEAIKLLPLVHAARRRPDVEVVLCNTGQHRENVGEGPGDFRAQAGY